MSTQTEAEDPDRPLLTRLAEAAGEGDGEEADAEALLEGFLEYAETLSLSLYDHQEEAILALFEGHHVILNTPTGSGKSLVAQALHFKAIAEGRRCYYTAPIKALVSEKFFALCRAFGPSQVGMMTGDASVNRDAPIVCCTAEILSNLALRDGPRAEVDYVVMDEFHYYSDPERGVAWQVPLLTLPQANFLLMSATMGRVAFFEERLRALTGREVSVVRSAKRPVPLDFRYSEDPLHETIALLYEQGRAPIYIVHFTQRAAAEQAQKLMSVDFLTKEEKQAIRDALGGFRFDTPFGKDLGRFVRHGVGVHHAGLLPKYRLMVEKLAQAGLLKIICGTDTLGVGVNVPIRSVLFTQLCKYDGKKTSVLTVRDFQQIAGRAGRKGFDVEGSVIAQAPEHVIENRRMRGKTGDDPKKLRKLKFKKAPERGYAHWDEETFQRLIESEPEPLVSSFAVSQGMLLLMLEGRADGCGAIKHLLRDCHERRHDQRRHARTAIAMYRSLLGTGVVEVVGEGEEAEVRVNADLQEDFSLNRSLSLYVLEALEALDPEDPDYAFDAISIVEATIEDPMAILLKQLDKKKTERLAELKAEGMEYEERMAELDKVEIPKPRAELIYATFHAFREKHPWVEGDPIRPKSIARDLLERSASFTMYVKDYGLSRSEGLLLRHLSHTYKALVQNIPENSKTEELYDLTTDLYEVIRRVDSSLIDEWEKLRDPARLLEEETLADEGPRDVTADPVAFTAMVRNAMFRLVRALGRKEWALAAEAVVAEEGAPEWSPERLEEAMAPYFEEHQELRLDPAARAPKNTRIHKGEEAWEVEQVLVDPEDSLDYRVLARVDLAASREAEEAVIALRAIGEAGMLEGSAP